MNILGRKSDYLWLAIAQVTPKPSSGLLDGAAGAHVAVFGLAEDEAGFVESAIKLLETLGFSVVELDEIESLSIQEFKCRVPKETYRVAKTLNESTPVGFGTFYTYEDAGNESTS